MNGPPKRGMSPSGGSTLMTSAPRAASRLVENGPANAAVRSTILTPRNGPVRPAAMGAACSWALVWSITATSPCLPVAAALDQNRALTLEDDAVVVGDAPVLEGDQPGIVPVRRRFRGQHLGEGVQGVAVVYRRPEAKVIDADLRQRVLGRVLTGQSDSDRRSDQAEDDPTGAERTALQIVLVPMGLGGVHHLLGDEIVLDLVDGRA